MTKKFFNVVVTLNGPRAGSVGEAKCFPMFRDEEPSLEDVRDSDEFAALMQPIYNEEASFAEDLSEWAREGEPEEAVENQNPVVDEARLLLTTENTRIFGPFSTPQSMDAKTYRVRRPDCQTSVVIVQAMSKGAARELVRTRFGGCFANEEVTTMIAAPGTNRILYPIP